MNLVTRLEARIENQTAKLKKSKSKGEDLVEEHARISRMQTALELLR